MNCTEINFGKYAKITNLDFESRTTGIRMRSLTKLDSCLQTQEKICFVIPDSIISMSQAFIEEYFGWVIYRVGVDHFWEKISFENEGRYEIENDIKYLLERQNTSKKIKEA